jgi:transposase
MYKRVVVTNATPE